MEAEIALKTGSRADHTEDESGNKRAGTNRLRGAVRLAAFLLITARYLASAAFMRLLRSAGAGHQQDGTLLVMRWTRAINSALGFEVTVRGTPPADTALLASNHRSYMDIAAIGSCLPVTFLAKKEIGRWPLIGPGCRLVHVVFVERESAASRWRSREEIARRLGDGMSIVVFPEGTSYEGPGLLSFRPGVFSLAAAGGFPVVPVAVSCEERADAWVGNDTFIRHFIQTFSRQRVRMAVNFGPVIRGNDPDRIRRSAWRWIDASLKKTSDDQL